jgi:hypothetical protein
MERMDDYMKRRSGPTARNVEDRRARERQRGIERQQAAAKVLADAETRRIREASEEEARRARAAREWAEMSGVITKFLAMKKHGNPGVTTGLGSGWRKKQGWLIKTRSEVEVSSEEEGPRMSHWDEYDWLLTDGSIWIDQDHRWGGGSSVIPRGRYGRGTVPLERLLELLAENGLTWT